MKKWGFVLVTMLLSLVCITGCSNDDDDGVPTVTVYTATASLASFNEKMPNVVSGTYTNLESGHYKYYINLTDNDIVYLKANFSVSTQSWTEEQLRTCLSDKEIKTVDIDTFVNRTRVFIGVAPSGGTTAYIIFKL